MIARGTEAKGKEGPENPLLYSYTVVPLPLRHYFLKTKESF